jgi:hypothetical protein
MAAGAGAAAQMIGVVLFSLSLLFSGHDKAVGSLPVTEGLR